MEPRGAATAAPLVFLGLRGSMKAQGGHIHFRHTGSALRLTANSPDAPILWSLNQDPTARRFVFSAAVTPSILMATAKRTACNLRVKQIRTTFSGQHARCRRQQEHSEDCGACAR